MSKRQKVITGINDKAIKETKVEVTNYLELLDRAKASLKNLTDDNVKDLSVKAIDEYLNNKTGFLNGLMSATAYNLQDEYKKLITLITDIDSGSESLNFITKGKIDDDKIQAAHTSYLREKYVEEYLRIKDAVDILNESSMYVLKHSLQFGRSEIYFDASGFESTKVMGGR